jgi:hypothetical protein
MPTKAIWNLRRASVSPFGHHAPGHRASCLYLYPWLCSVWWSLNSALHWRLPCLHLHLHLHLQSLECGIHTHHARTPGGSRLPAPGCTPPTRTRSAPAPPAPPPPHTTPHHPTTTPPHTPHAHAPHTPHTHTPHTAHRTDAGDRRRPTTRDDPLGLLGLSPSL